MGSYEYDTRRAQLMNTFHVACALFPPYGSADLSISMNGCAHVASEHPESRLASQLYHGPWECLGSVQSE